MNNRILLLMGVVIPLLFTSAILGLATMVDGYSHVSQTVSEIGELGSPAELLWKVADVTLSLCFLLFAVGIYRFCLSNTIAILPAIFVAYFGLMSIGISVFESPHPLHNLFGLSMIFGYMAPLVLALCWRGQQWAKPLVNFSWIIWVLLMISIFLNLSPLFIRNLYPLDYYGLVQRSLFLVFYGIWCPVLSLTLFRASTRSSNTFLSNATVDAYNV